ncbi:thioester domain-containing protein [Leucobacter weissii]|uniref:Thioester domain-containing protein n=1 Tax=Leucobacter weissii TaxID=1983706 RepID=A0A939MJY8_9MICO|nr:thioester domain-containing protein [Leucobacter weissii]MBO1901365.1 thioester domain-containing protein [Leucobacter weissii]
MSAHTRTRNGTRPTLRSIGAAALGALLLLPAIGIAASPAVAAVGDTYRIINPTSNSGTSIRFDGSGSNTVTRLWTLQGQSGAATQSSYSVDFHGTSPTTNNEYTQADWVSDAPPHGAAALSATAQANRGRIEWILKNSYPAVGTSSSLNALRDDIRAAGYTDFPTASWWQVAEGIAGTQAAIWHLTDGVDLDLANTTPNNDRIKILYRYLLEQSADAVASTPDPPTVEVVSETGRDPFSVEPGASFGPFALESSVNATLSVSGPAVVIDEQGVAVSGPQAPGTRFWLRPTASPAAPGSATVTATTVDVTSTVVNAAFGRQHVSPNAVRETLAVTSTDTQNATHALTASWVLDQSNPGDFDPDGSATEREFVYNQPGEQSATLQNIVFTDGTSTTTDAIGLAGIGTPGLDAYSADFPGTGANTPLGPNVADQTRFTEKDWNAAAKLADNDGQEEVARILSDAYPNTSLANLTAALKNAGLVAPSAGNIKSWEAYAGAQAAIWHFTDGKDLDTTRYADPVAVTASSTADGFSAERVLNAESASGWRANAAGEATLDFTFPARFEPRSYSVASLDGGAQANTPTGWKLQRSFDGGATYQDVSTSAVTHSFAGGSAETRVSGNIPPGASYGSWTTDLRLVFTGAHDPEQPVEIGAVSFEGFGVFGAQPNESFRQYANNTNVVHLYTHLLARAASHPIPNPEPQTELSGDTLVQRESGDELIGPFTLAASLAPSDPLSARVTVSGHSAGAGLVTDPLGTPADFLDLADGQQFYFAPLDGETGDITLTARTTAQSWVTARALDGVRQGAQGPVLTGLGVQSLSAVDTLELAFGLLGESTLAPDAGEAQPGQTVVLTGANFRAGETITLAFGDPAAPILSEPDPLVADEHGAFEATITVPADAAPGPHRIVATGAASGRTADTQLSVVPAPVLTLSPEVVPQGGVFDASGIDFRPGDLVRFELHAGTGTTAGAANANSAVSTSQAAAAEGPVLGTATVQADGSVAFRGRIPADTPPGDHDLLAVHDGQNVELARARVLVEQAEAAPAPAPPSDPPADDEPAPERTPDEEDGEKELADTGSAPLDLVGWLALAALGVGAVLVGARRGARR